jgi:hypothetical protein
MEDISSNLVSSIRMYINLIESSDDFVVKIFHTIKYFEVLINNFYYISEKEEFFRFIETNVNKTKEIRKSIYKRIDINYTSTPSYIQQYEDLLNLMDEFERLATPFGFKFEQPVMEIDINN